MATDVAWMGAAAEWPSVIELRERWGSIAATGDLYEGASAQAWVLMRDLEPVAVFDRLGDVLTANSAVDLLGTYREFGDNLGRAVEAALGDYLK